MTCSVELIGDGPDGAVLIPWVDVTEPALLIRVQRGLVRNMTIVGPGTRDPGSWDSRPAVLVEAGSVDFEALTVVDCPGTALWATSKRAVPSIRHSRLAGTCGVRFSNAAGGVVEDVALSGEHGLLVEDPQTDPLFRRVAVRATYCAALAQGGATLRVEESTLALDSPAEHLAVIRVGGSATTADVTGSAISTGQWQVGVYVTDGASARLVGNQILGGSGPSKLGVSSKWGVGFESSITASEVFDNTISGHAIGVMYDARGPLSIRGNGLLDCGTAIGLGDDREWRAGCDVSVIANDLEGPVSLHAKAVYLDAAGVRTGNFDLGVFRFEGNRMSGGGEWIEVHGIPAADLLHPASSLARESVGVFDAAQLLHGLTRVTYAAADFEWGRRDLSTLRFRISGSECELAASDNYRLALDRVPVHRSDSQAVELLVPKAAALLLTDRLDGEPLPVALDIVEDPRAGFRGARDRLAVFRWPKGVVVAEVSDGPYPDVDALLRRVQPRTIANVAARELLDLISRAESSVVLLRLSAEVNTPLLKPDPPVTIVVPIAEGPDASVAVLSAKLVEALCTFGSAVVTVELTPGFEAVTLRSGTSLALVVGQRTGNPE
jgi:hypothetical protein